MGGAKNQTRDVPKNAKRKIFFKKIFSENTKKTNILFRNTFVYGCLRVLYDFLTKNNFQYFNFRFVQGNQAFNVEDKNN